MGEVVRFPLSRPMSTALDRLIREARASDVVRMIRRSKEVEVIGRPVADGHDVDDLTPEQQAAWAHMTFNGG